MLLSLERPHEAARPLREAAVEMQDFRAEGEFRALVGHESAKTWKGEPYEKMAAFVTLGALLQQDGDLGNARAMYKSAILADAGTVEERYRSDFVAPWVLQGLSYAAQGRGSQALDSIERAQDALYARRTIDRLVELVEHSSPSSEPGQLAAALLLMGVPAGGTASPRDPVRAAELAVSQAFEVYRQQKELRPRDRNPSLRGAVQETWAAAPVALDALGAQLIEGAAYITDYGDVDREARQLGALLESDYDTWLLIEVGEGPHKGREGSYGQLLVIHEGSGARAPQVEAGGERWPVVTLDSYSYQATTRGSRRVDAYLEGKAVYKEASYVTGWVLWELAEALAFEGAEGVAVALYATGCVLMVSSVATQPQADIREWGLLPEQLVLAPMELGPGRHEVLVDGRSVVVDVPQGGQTFRLVPRPL